MGKSIKEFCGVDSLYKRPDGSKISHEELFTKVVDAVGLENLTKYIPATREQVIEALKENPYLNNIPLKCWDIAYPNVKARLSGVGITSVSLSDTVCTLKQAARLWAERGENK